MVANRPAELRRLPEDWDSYGAKKITDAAIRTAEHVVYVPSPDGGVQIELHAGGADVEIEVDAAGAVVGVYWAKPNAA